MRKLEVKLEVVTPIFSSGADQTKFELRPSTIKGLIRYWWRVAEVVRREKSKEKIDWGEIRKLEEKYFGSTKKASPIRVIVKRGRNYRVKSIEEIRWEQKNFRQRGSQAQKPLPYYAAYMMGLGLVSTIKHQDNQNRRKEIGFFPNREFLKPGSEIILEFIQAAPPSKEKEISEDEANRDLWKAWALGIRLMIELGGIGARARKGLGSVKIRSSHLSRLSDPFDGWQMHIKRKVQDAKIKIYEARIPANDYVEALNVFGQHYKAVAKTIEYPRIFGAPRRRRRGSYTGRHPSPFWAKFFKSNGNWYIRLTLLPEKFLKEIFAKDEVIELKEKLEELERRLNNLHN